MESNVALLRAASGLERLMAGVPQTGPIKDSTVAQVSAYLYYQANVLASLESNAAFKNLFKTTIFNQIEKDFGEYIDAKARISPKSLHHVYEWNKVGKPQSRLFKLYMMETPGLSFKLNFEFMPSRSSVPSKNVKQKKRYIFANKARVMEDGQPLIITPKNAERLVFQINGQTVFMPKGQSVTIRKPGGSASTNQFTLAYSRFFSGAQVNNSIKNSGFQHIFNSKMAKALSIPSSIKKVQYSFSPNSIKMQADAALTASFGGAL